MKSCDPSKALGYDGYNMRFIRNMWEEIGLEVMNFVSGFFEAGIFLKEINTTWVVLSPKFDDACEVKDF